MTLGDLRKNWERFAREDARWAVLTSEANRDGRWEDEEFFATGRRVVDGVLTRAADLDAPARRHAALDFGCGVGRITRALGDHFDEVTGIDISDAMVDQATELHADRPECRFVANQEEHLGRFPSGSFDLVFSTITLQHMDRSLARGYLAEFLRVVRADGLVVFDLPVPRPQDRVRQRIPRSLLSLYRVLRWRLVGPRMEMHGMSTEEVTHLVSRHGGQVVHAEPCYAGGPGMRYFVTPVSD